MRPNEQSRVRAYRVYYHVHGVDVNVYKDRLVPRRVGLTIRDGVKMLFPLGTSFGFYLLYFSRFLLVCVAGVSIVHDCLVPILRFFGGAGLYAFLCEDGGDQFGSAAMACTYVLLGYSYFCVFRFVLCNGPM